MTLTSRNGTEFPDLQVVAGNRVTVPYGSTHYDEAIDGGMESLTFQIPDQERKDFPQIWGRNGTPIMLRVHADETAAMQPGERVWQGTIWRVGPASSGLCDVVAVGGSMKMRRSQQDVMFAVDALAQWSERDDEDANGPHNHENFTVKVDGSKLHFVADPNAYGYGNSAGFALVVTGAKARKITAILDQDKTHPNFSLRIRRFTAPLEGRNANLMTQLGNLVNLGNATDGQLISRASHSVANRAQAQNAINVDMMMTNAGGVVNDKPQAIWLQQVRVWDRADTDDYFSTQVMQVLATLMNYDSAKVVNFTVPRVLPLFHDRSQSLDALADLMSTFQQGFWLVNYRTGATGPFELTFTTWGGTHTTTWYTTMAEIKGDSLEPSRDLYNAQRVYYRTTSGRQRNVVVFADGLNGRPGDPFQGTEFAINQSPLYAPPIDMPDRQADSTLALGVAELSIKDLAIDRLQGDLRVLSLHTGSPTGPEFPACLAHAGDQLVIADYPEAGPGGIPGPKTLRLYQKDGDDAGVGFTVDRRPTSVARFMARREKLLERKNLPGA